MTTVISVRFRSGSKGYYFDPGTLEIAAGDDVIVETAAGAEYGRCVEGRHDVEDQQVVVPLRPVLRLATEGDRRTNQRNQAREKEAFQVCEKKIAAHHLEMKLIRVECSFEGSKIIFFFTADGRVDFRELVKDLAATFRTRIELRQVGVRDEAKMLGGLGICGRPLCCSQFLDQFAPVSIKMAKVQNLSLNPTKISGTCGRLMCCLKYEQAAYEDAGRRMPKVDSFVNTPDGPGNVCGVDLLREEAKVRLDESPETVKIYKAQEMEILRSGKGSREGIVVPAERPKRCARPQEESYPAVDRFGILRDFTEMSPAEDDEERPRNGRRRRSRGKERPVRQEAPRPERPESPERHRDQRNRKRRGSGQDQPEPTQVERIQVKPNGDSTAEKKAAADRRAKAVFIKPEERPKNSGEGQRRRRPRRKGKDE